MVWKYASDQHLQTPYELNTRRLLFYTACRIYWALAPILTGQGAAVPLGDMLPKNVNRNCA